MANNILARSRTLHLTMRFEVSVIAETESDLDSLPSTPHIEQAVRRLVDSYSDGRFPFPVEQLADGANRVIGHALQMALEHESRQRYGDEMGADPRRGRAAKAVLVAEECFRKLHHYTKEPDPDFVTLELE